MSRRRASGPGRERAGESGRERSGRESGSGSGRESPRRPAPGRGRPLGFLAQLLVLAAAFGIGVGVAEAAGAANLGTAFGIGQIVFAITLVFLLLRA
jgi:hypothetical protein